MDFKVKLAKISAKVYDKFGPSPKGFSKQEELEWLLAGLQRLYHEESVMLLNIISDIEKDKPMSIKNV